jgi:hypothetical protein
MCYYQLVGTSSVFILRCTSFFKIFYICRERGLDNKQHLDMSHCVC